MNSKHVNRILTAALFGAALSCVGCDKRGEGHYTYEYGVDWGRRYDGVIVEHRYDGRDWDRRHDGGGWDHRRDGGGWNHRRDGGGWDHRRDGGGWNRGRGGRRSAWESGQPLAGAQLAGAASASDSIDDGRRIFDGGR